MSDQGVLLPSLAYLVPLRAAIMPLLSTVLALCAVACEEPAPPPSEPPGVTVARKHLYPYHFTEQQTVRGMRVLSHYLEAAPQGRDARMATWLLARTHLDLLTRAITLRAVGEDTEARELTGLLARELAVSSHDPDLARAIRSRLESFGGDDVLAAEAKASVQVLEAIIGREDSRRMGQPLAAVADGELEVATNARLLIAAQAMTLFADMGGLAPERTIDYLAARYPFPCPEGFAAFAEGDRSLDACGFACPRAATALHNAPLEAHKAILVKECGPKHFGFVDREDAQYLSRENYIIVQMLRHMSANLVRLEGGPATPLRDLHTDFVAQYKAFVASLAMPAQPPLLGPGDLELQLLSLPARQPATLGVQQTAAITGSGLYLNIPTRFRVERGQIYMPEVILRYTFPGRLAAATATPFVLGLPNEAGTVEAALLSLLDDLERDRPRLTARVGDLVPGAAPAARLPQEPSRSLVDTRRTGLLLDRRTTMPLLSLLLNTLHDQGYHPFELLVWHPRLARPAAIAFDTELGPVPLGAEVVWLDESGWVHRSREGKVSHNAAAADPEIMLIELYWKAERSGTDHPLYVVPAAELSLARLASAVEVLNRVHGGDRAPRGNQLGLDEFLARTGGDPSTDRGRAARSRVVVALAATPHPR